MLPQSLFENPKGKDQVASESDVFYLVEKVECDKGIRTYIKGAEYYQKGQAPAETLFFLNIAKRITVEGMKLGSKLPVVIGFMLGQAILPKRYKLSIQSLLATYNSILWKVISPYILKEENMIEMPREVRRFVFNFLKELGVQESIAYQSSAIISHFFEYDNAYRYRVQDLLNETTKEEFLTNTQQVLKSFMRLSRERDNKCVSDKLVSGIKIISWALRIPKFNRAFRFALSQSDFEKFQYDEIDIYWVSMRNDYLYLGEDVETRAKRNKSIPVPMPKEEYDKYISDLQRNNNEVMILKSIDVLLKSKHYRKIIKQKLK